MKIDLISDGKRAEIEISIETNYGYGTVPVSERFLIPEARRLRDKLNELIKKGEQINRPGTTKLGDFR